MGKNLKIFLTLFLLLFFFLPLISCEKSEQIEKVEKIESEVSNTQNIIPYESLVTSFVNPQTKQTFKIVDAYKLYQNYIDEVKKNPDDSYMDIYKKEVIEPIYSDCFQSGEYSHLAEPTLTGNPEHLNITSTHLGEVQNLIDKIDNQQTDKIIKEAFLNASNILPGKKEITACVLPSNNRTMNMLTVGAGKILVLYNLNYTDDAIRAGIAHEYHHSVWTENYYNKNLLSSVLDNMIFEGKAVMFEKVVYPDIDFTRVDLTYNKDYWSKIADDLDKSDLNRSFEVLFGGNDLPLHYGYSEGYKMVKSYLELHPNVTPADWTATSPKEIFEKGKYLENYQ